MELAPLVEIKSWFGDTRVARLSASKDYARRALVFFHGFPGQPPKGEEHKYAGQPRLRLEAAKALAARAGYDVFLPGYEGLGESRGAFGFVRAVESSVSLARLLAREYERLDVAGHSWGGLVAFNAHRALDARAGRLALFAGLLDLESEASVRAFLPPYLEKYPDILGAAPGAFERAAADLEAVRRGFNPLTLAAPMPRQALLIAHGRGDVYVSVDVSRRFHAKAGGAYLESDADHLFLGAAMAETVGALVSFLG